MKYSGNPLRPRTLLMVLACLLVFFPAMACTIFVLTDGNNTIFFNNEDYSNPSTRIWFQPGGEGFYGAAYVGFDNGWAQGGVNTKGLAFDWFAGGKVDYVPDENLINAKQNACQRMLETCSTVEEAIVFFKTYLEIGFSEATILIAEKSGASVVIGAKKGKIYFEKSNQNAAIGYGLNTFNKLHGGEASANLADGTEILHQCVQKGKYGTKYSSVYDLKTGQITINQFLEGIASVDFNLFVELEKGGHYYDIPKIHQQLEAPLMPLLFNQTRLSLYEFDDISAEAPEIVEIAQKLIQNVAQGRLQSDMFSEVFWNSFKEEEGALKESMVPLGELKSIYLIKQEQQDSLQVNSFITVYENARVLMQISFDGRRQIRSIATVNAEVTNTKAYHDLLDTGHSKFKMKDYYGLFGFGVFMLVLLTLGVFLNKNSKKMAA